MSPSPVLPFGPAALALDATAGELRLDAAVSKHTGDVERDGRDDDRDDTDDELDERGPLVPIAPHHHIGVREHEHPDWDEEVPRHRELLALIHVPHGHLPPSRLALPLL